MEKTAPYADIPISISLVSVTGLKYRTLNCLECGQPFLERNSEKVFRIGTNQAPSDAHVDAGGVILGICGRCSQKYSVTVSMAISGTRVDLPLYMQPQSIFIVNEPNKRLRDTHCMECGKTFYSISDRITSLSDNVTPLNMLDPERMGPMEARCKFHHCKQRWYIRV